MDVVFAEILVFSNIFGFLALNWAPKWNKTVNFECVPFKLNFKKISARLKNIWGSKSPKNPKRGHFIDTESLGTKKLKIF